MKLQAQIDDGIHEVEIRREGDRVFADVDGRKYELEASEPEPNVYLLKCDNKVFEIFVSHRSPGGSTLVRIGTDEMEIRLIDPKRLHGTGSDAIHGDGLAEIKTAMPGKVVRLLVAVGDRVEKDSGVIVVEAMKMQNEMKSPKDGLVKEIRTAEGSTVNAGEILVIIE